VRRPAFGKLVKRLFLGRDTFVHGQQFGDHVVVDEQQFFLPEPGCCPSGTDYSTTADPSWPCEHETTKAKQTTETQRKTMVLLGASVPLW
jgi:hypothetical protein